MNHLHCSKWYVGLLGRFNLYKEFVDEKFHNGLRSMYLVGYRIGAVLGNVKDLPKTIRFEWNNFILGNFFLFFFQVTCEYYFLKGACVPSRVHTVVVSVQHSDKITLEDLRRDVMEKVIKAVIPEKYLDERTVYHINPCGQFVLGGPQVIFVVLIDLLGMYVEKTLRSFMIFGRMEIFRKANVSNIDLEISSFTYKVFGKLAKCFIFEKIN